MLRLGKISLRLSDDGSFEIDVRGHRITVDDRKENGADEAGPTPSELFVSSLAACTATLAGSYLARHGLSTDGLSVAVEYEMADEPRRVGAISIAISVSVSLSNEQRTRMLKVVERCTVHNSITHPPEVNIRLA